ncbi:uncharacterized protein N0V89_000507 [Didymosphaeria variabile]|uniref:CENP-V/GFA domain-containing protein n=1 Tax=Didymosphaeria variabile TaxID=1932322 RepID=A0A9W8XVA3_9PLEO|nr:uncharacterized protein N0V89_000507 [Didymosphaeria variabile]KAJ4359948.1 hypothetical protein N0V89_000507 [Didymosphaeria variabile]
MVSAEDVITQTANCLCKANIFTTNVPKSKLPLKGWACHCESCRHVTGALCTLVTSWPEKRASVDVSGLKAYSFSSRYDLLFCSICSTPIFFANKQETDKELGLLTGTLRNTPGDVVKITNHIFVGDTQDGGASMWLRKPNADGTEAKRYRERAETDKGESAEAVLSDWPPHNSLTGSEAKKEGPVPIWCKCKGVSLVWQPGSYNGIKDDELPWFVDPATHKALAGFCACESCRLFGGVDVWNWGFAELKDIRFANKQPGFPASSDALRALVDAKDPSIGTLTYFASSSDAQRYFCSNCSASVFYASDDRTFMVDVALGVLGASDGARAEGYFSWAYGGAISHLEENSGYWRYDLFDRVAKEGERWRIDRNYPKNWRRLAREKAAEKA